MQRQKRASHQIRVVRQPIERNAGVGRKRTDAGPTQFDHMSVAPKRATEIPRNRAHVGALAAFGLEHRCIGLSRYQFEPVDIDRARFNLKGFAFAREIVGARAGDPDRGKGRRRLQDGADEARQKAFDLGWSGAQVGARDDLPFSVVGGAFLAPSHRNR